MDSTEQVAEAQRLGTNHGRAGITPYGDLDDAGSADLMTALGETGPPTAGDHEWRTRLLAHYGHSWQYAAGRDYMTPPAPAGALTPARFVLALASDGLNAELETFGGPGSWPLPMGYLPDGRGWILGDEDDTGWVGPKAPMPGLLNLAVYESATEDERCLEFNEPVAILARISADRALEAIRRAWSGDYRTFTGDTVGPAPLIEDLTVPGPDGQEQPRFDEATRAYLRAVRFANPATIAPWQTVTCPFCGQAFHDGGAVISGAERQYAHVRINGTLALGCHRYPLIDPAVLGLDRGHWHDWRRAQDAAYIGYEASAGSRYVVTLSGTPVGQPQPSYPTALSALRAEFATRHWTAELARPAGQAPPVYYIADDRGLIVKFPCPLAEVGVDWDRPARQQDEAWWASLGPHITVNAMCLLCGQTCTPHGPDDMTHGMRRADDDAAGPEEPCGGPLVILGASAPRVGIPYAWTDPETGARTCPVCQEIITEDYDGDGEPLTNRYADHYQREHASG